MCHPHSPNIVCSPFDLVPKNNPGKYRLIHDLSFPKDVSVKSGIPKYLSQVQYDNIETIISLVKVHGHGALMAKYDIEDAFRIIPIHPGDQHLLVSHGMTHIITKLSPY